MSGTSKYPRTGKRGAPQAFARKLYEILQNEDAGVIAWSSTGDAFVIRDLDEFVNSVLLKYFRHQKFSSFQRQLNLYGFRKVHKGMDAGAYAHQNFKRNHQELLDQIRRTPQSNARGKGSRSRSGSVVSYDDDCDEDDENEEQEEQLLVERKHSVVTRSCMSSLATCLGTQLNASVLPPPPSYEAVMRADAAVIPSSHTLKRELSNEFESSRPNAASATSPFQQTSDTCFPSIKLSANAVPTENLNPTVFSDAMYERVSVMKSVPYPTYIKEEPRDSVPMDEGLDVLQFNSMGSIGSFDINDEVCMELDTQPLDASSSRGSFNSGVQHQQPTTFSFSQLQQPTLARPNFCRMFSEQSQEWDMETDGLEEEIDFDKILNELCRPSAPIEQFRYIPEATPVEDRPIQYPVAEAQVVSLSPHLSFGGHAGRRYNTRASSSTPMSIKSFSYLS